MQSTGTSFRHATRETLCVESMQSADPETQQPPSQAGGTGTIVVPVVTAILEHTSTCHGLMMYRVL